MTTVPTPAPETADAWQLTGDLDEFLARAGDYLATEPAAHTVLLTVTDTLRRRGLHAYGEQEPVFAMLAEGGEVRGVMVRTTPHRPLLSRLTAPAAEALVARLLAGPPDLHGELPGVSADAATATAFAQAWQRSTGAEFRVEMRQRLYRLGTLTVPEPVPPGRTRIAGEDDRELLMRWYVEFCEAVGEAPAADPGFWADTRLAYGGITLWEAADGTPLAMSGATRPVAGQVRVAPVYTPAALRGHGYAGAATAEVTRAVLDAGAQEVLLFTDLANPTSNGLYQRIGYRPVDDFTVYGFTATATP